MDAKIIFCDQGGGGIPLKMKTSYLNSPFGEKEWIDVIWYFMSQNDIQEEDSCNVKTISVIVWNQLFFSIEHDLSIGWSQNVSNPPILFELGII